MTGIMMSGRVVHSPYIMLEVMGNSFYIAIGRPKACHKDDKYGNGNTFEKRETHAATLPLFGRRPKFGLLHWG